MNVILPTLGNFDAFPTPAKSAWQYSLNGYGNRPQIVSCMDRDKQDRHETPVGVSYNPESTRRWSGSLSETAPSLWAPHHVPETDYEALMVCAPFQDPKLARQTEDWEFDSQMIEGILSCLSDKERSAIELVVFGQMSLAQAGVMMGEEYGRTKPYSKALVAKYRDSALVKLKEHFGVN